MRGNDRLPASSTACILTLLKFRGTAIVTREPAAAALRSRVVTPEPSLNSLTLPEYQSSPGARKLSRLVRASKRMSRATPGGRESTP